MSAIEEYEPERCKAEPETEGPDAARELLRTLSLPAAMALGFAIVLCATGDAMVAANGTWYAIVIWALHTLFNIERECNPRERR